MNPTAAAAAALVRNSEGSVKKAGKYATVPVPIMAHNTTSRPFECGSKNHAPSAAAAASCGTAKCHRRSPKQSDLHPATSNPTVAAANGIAPTQPIKCTSVQPVSRCRIVGNQNQNA